MKPLSTNKIILPLLLCILSLNSFSKNEFPKGPYFIIRKNGDTIYARDKNSIRLDRRKTTLDKDLLRFGFMYINDRKIAIKKLRCAALPHPSIPDTFLYYFICGGREKYFLKAKYLGKINVFELKDTYISHVTTSPPNGGASESFPVERLKLHVYIQRNGDKRTLPYSYDNLLELFPDDSILLQAIEKMEAEKIKLIERNARRDGHFSPRIDYRLIELINKN